MGEKCERLDIWRYVLKNDAMRILCRYVDTCVKINGFRYTQFDRAQRVHKISDPYQSLSCEHDTARGIWSISKRGVLLATASK